MTSSPPYLDDALTLTALEGGGVKTQQGKRLSKHIMGIVDHASAVNRIFIIERKTTHELAEIER